MYHSPKYQSVIMISGGTVAIFLSVFIRLTIAPVAVSLSEHYVL